MSTLIPIFEHHDSRFIAKIVKPSGDIVADIRQAGMRDTSHSEVVGLTHLFAGASELLAEARETAAALDALLQQHPMMAATVCGATTLGDQRATLKAAIQKAEGVAA